MLGVPSPRGGWNTPTRRHLIHGPPPSLVDTSGSDRPIVEEPGSSVSRETGNTVASDGSVVGVGEGEGGEERHPPRWCGSLCVPMFPVSADKDKLGGL